MTNLQHKTLKKLYDNLAFYAEENEQGGHYDMAIALRHQAHGVFQAITVLETLELTSFNPNKAGSYEAIK